MANAVLCASLKARGYIIRSDSQQLQRKEQLNSFCEPCLHQARSVSLRLCGERFPLPNQRADFAIVTTTYHLLLTHYTFLRSATKFHKHQITDSL